MTEEEIDDFAKKVAVEYALSELKFSRTYFTKIYNITPKCFYQLLYRAIVRNLVTDEIVYKMWKKARENSNIKSKENTGKLTNKTDINYTKLMKERRWFIWLQEFPEERKVEVTTYFAQHPESSKKECATIFELTISQLDKVLEDTIVKNLVDDDIFLTIRKRSIGNNKDNKVAVNYFAKLKRKRQIRKNTVS